MVDALWKIEWGVCCTDNCCNDICWFHWWSCVDGYWTNVLMNTRICHTTIISLYYYYRYTSGNVDDTVILPDDTVIVFDDTVIVFDEAIVLKCHIVLWLQNKSW